MNIITFLMSLTKPLRIILGTITLKGLLAASSLALLIYDGIIYYGSNYLYIPIINGSYYIADNFFWALNRIFKIAIFIYDNIIDPAMDKVLDIAYKN